MSALVVLCYRLMWLESQDSWDMIALKFHPTDLRSYETLAALAVLLLNGLDESLHLHHQTQKHSPSAMDLNTFLCNKHRKLLLFLQWLQQDRINAYSIKSA